MSIISTDQDGVTITVNPHHLELSPRADRPLDLEAIEGRLQDAAQQVIFNARAYKLVHDAKLLRAALYAMASGNSLEDAHHLIETHRDDELKAEMLLAGSLIQGGWKQVTPDTTPHRDTTVEKAGLFGISCSEQKGKAHSGEVLVNIGTGAAIVAEANSAFTYKWVTVLGRRPYEITDTQGWWLTGNWKKDTPHQEDRYDARNALTVPDLPVDLHALLAYVGGE